MRQALGLRHTPGGGPVAQRREGEQRGRRFVKDGEVPVVVVHSGSREAAAEGAAPINRIVAAEQQARADRLAREQAERALAEAQTTLQHLRTQLAHAEFAHREALAAERSARELVEQSLREAIEARAAVEARLLEAEAAARRATAEPDATDAATVEAAPRVARRGRPRRVVQAEPDETPAAPRKRGRPKRVEAEAAETEAEPVKWWLPTYRAAARAR